VWQNGPTEEKFCYDIRFYYICWSMGRTEGGSSNSIKHTHSVFIHSESQRGGLGPSKTSADKRKQFFCRPEALPCKIYVSYFVGAFSVMVPTSTAYRHLFCFFVLCKNQLKACGLTASIRHAHGHLLVSKSTAFCYPKVQKFAIAQNC